MLSKEMMGALALAILWVNVLLIAAAAGKQLAALLRRRAALAGAVRGRVTRGNGPGGALAVHRIEQVGRAAGDDAILFHDRRAGGEVFGGEVTPEGGAALTLRPQPAEVWVDAEALSRAAACPSTAELDRAHAAARKIQGFERTVSATVDEGAEVYVSTGGEVLVAAMDPRALLAKKAALSAAFIAGDLLAAAACTTLALWPPRFGAVSTVGGALSLALFLAVQPAGTAVRDAVLVPSRAFLRGRWSRARAEHATSAV